MIIQLLFIRNPIEGCYNVYSPRKFFGVPDGCYVIGDNADKYVAIMIRIFHHQQLHFFLKEWNMGSSETYSERMKNEERIDNSGILKNVTSYQISFKQY